MSQLNLMLKWVKSMPNQKYRALIVGTADGIKNFTSDADAIAAGYVKETDSKWCLDFGANDIKGYETLICQVS